MSDRKPRTEKQAEAIERWNTTVQDDIKRHDEQQEKGGK